MLKVTKINIENDKVIFIRRLSEFERIKEVYELDRAIEISINTNKYVKIEPTFNKYKVGEKLICIKNNHDFLAPCEIVEIAEIIKKKRINLYKLEGYNELFTADMLDDIFRRY